MPRPQRTGRRLLVARLYRVEWVPDDPGEQWVAWADTRREAEEIADRQPTASIEVVETQQSRGAILQLLQAEAERTPPEN